MERREEDNVNDSPGPDWSNKMDRDAAQRDEKPRIGLVWLRNGRFFYGHVGLLLRYLSRGIK